MVMEKKRGGSIRSPSTRRGNPFDRAPAHLGFTNTTNVPYACSCISTAGNPKCRLAFKDLDRIHPETVE